MIAAIVAGHHAGLSDGADLDRRLDPSHPIPDSAAWPSQAGPLPPAAALRPTRQPVAPTGPGLSWAFRTRMLFIDAAMEPVIVPWQASPEDNEAEDLLGRIAAMDRPLAGDLRRLQGYTVPIPPKVRAAWLAHGTLAPVHPQTGDALLRLTEPDLYDARIGLRLDCSLDRAAEDNIIG